MQNSILEVSFETSNFYLLIDMAFLWKLLGACSINTEVFCVLWTPKFLYRAHKCAPIDCALMQLNPVHALCNMPDNITLP
jgi:hypothetical protein